MTEGSDTCTWCQCRRLFAKFILSEAEGLRVTKSYFMFKRFRNYFIRNRYSVSVFILLNIACAVCIGLVLARVAYSDSSRHIGLIWNLFLAWIPFILAYFAHAVSWRRVSLYFIIP